MKENPLQYRVRGTPVPTTQTRGTNYPKSTWVSWWNETRLHQSLDYRTPVEVETEFWKQNPPQEIIEIKANA